MNANNEQIETIERYLNRQLSPSEMVAFENKIAQYPAFATEVAQHRLVHELIADRGLLDIKQKMQNSSYDQYFDQPKGKNYLYGGLVVGLLLLSASTYFWFYQPKKIEINSVEKAQTVEQVSESNSEKTAPTLVQQEVERRTSLPKTLVSKPKNPIVSNSNQEEQPVVEETAELEIIASAPISTTSKTELSAERKPVSIISSEVAEEPKTQNSFVPKEPRKTMEFAFSPSLGQVWEFPMEENANCKLTILNKSGQIVHEATIQNGYPNSWNGTSSRGLSITMGSYIYLFEYQNGQVERGYVTVTQ